MSVNIKMGKYGEELAVEFLLNKGHNILARNYRFKKSEIDIITLCNNILIFAEVKTRTSDDYGYPETFVGHNQKEKIFEGALHYIEEQKWTGNVRYDIVSVNLSVTPADIQHFEDAFY